MRTILQTINDTAQEYITIPLKRFFLYITLALAGLMLLTSFIAPATLSKFIAIIGLYGVSILTAILSYANIVLEEIEQLELSSEMLNETHTTNDSIIEQKHDDGFMA